jgi:hypothetical protein
MKNEEDVVMRSKRTILSGITLVFALLTGSIVTGASAQQQTRESASGHGTVFRTDASGKQVRRQFSFSAHRQPDGTVKGNAVLNNPAFTVDNGQRYQLQIEITCMQVVGNIAIFGGNTRRTNDPGLVDAVFFTVQDNGEPGKGVDRISAVYFWDDLPETTGDPQACLLTGPTDFPFEPIESGNIQVRPTAP